MIRRHPWRIALTVFAAFLIALLSTVFERLPRDLAWLFAACLFAVPALIAGAVTALVWPAAKQGAQVIEINARERQV